MYLLILKFWFLDFLFLLNRVAPYLQFVTTNNLKIAKLHIFVHTSLNIYSRVLWYAKFDGGVFIKIPLI